MGRLKLLLLYPVVGADCRATLAVFLPDCAWKTPDYCIEMLDNGFTENLVITDTNLAANERL